MFIVWRVLGATLGGTVGTVAILAALRGLGLFPRFDPASCMALCLPSCLLGILFAGPAGPGGWVRGALAAATPGILLGPIGVLPLGIAGGIAAALFPRDNHGPA